MRVSYSEHPPLPRPGAAPTTFYYIIPTLPQADEGFLRTNQPFVRGVIELGLPELLAQATGSTFPNVSAQQLAEIPYPSLDEDEQWAIAHILGTLDDKIDLNRRMNETLEGTARALFKSWFVDFEPVRAKMEGRWRRGESLPGLPAEHYDLFPDRLVDSELGEVPEGWEVKGLGEVALQRRSGVKPEEIDAESPYIALEHMPKRCIALNPNPPKDTDGRREKSGGRGEGATGEIAWVPFGVGRSADGLHRRTGAPMAVCGNCNAQDGERIRSKELSRTGLARVCGDLRLSGGWVGRRRCRQAGNGMARSRAKARLNFSAQGQRSGRCRVNRRAERVSRPAREKNRRRRVLVVAIRSPRPIRAVQRARLWAIVWTASQAPLAAKRPEGRWFSPTPYLRSL